MTYFTWEDNLSWLRNPESKVSRSLLICEMPMRWKDVKIGDYEVLPLKHIERSMVIHDSLYSRVMVLKKRGTVGKDDFFEHANVGPAVSSIVSFAIRSLVIPYRGVFMPLAPRDEVHLTMPGRFWAEGWFSVFRHQEGLRGLHTFHAPSPQNEEDLVREIQQVYQALMKLDEKAYRSLMGALRLYQAAFFMARIDYSLTYSFLVAAIDAASNCLKSKKKPKDNDLQRKMKKLMDEYKVDDRVQNSVRSTIAHGTLTKSFSNFITENLPNTFWEGDYSGIRESEDELLSDFSSEADYLRDLSEDMPESMKHEYLRKAEEEEKRYAERNKIWAEAIAERRNHRFFDEEQRGRIINYLMGNLDRILTDTYASRSSLFHDGRGFPKPALDEGFSDWIPSVFGQYFIKFPEEVKMMFNVHVFERIVHDSILNFTLELVE